MAENKKVRTIDQGYHKLLDADSHPIPESYRRDSPIEPGPTRVAIERYTSQAFHDLEVEKIWKKTWQMACHEDDMPEVGDCVPYDIARLSFLVVRIGKDEFKAYYNSCLHRGRKLREARGKGATELRCPFHGWCWNLDGSLKEVPCEWDYPELDREEHSLPEVQVARWGRYIFINPDPDAEPFRDFIGDLSSHFEVLPYEQRYKEAHVAKIVRCNWKIASEAFMESYHVVGTHPQILLGGVNDTDTKYDVFGNYSRAIRCGALEASGLPEWEAMPDDGRIRAMHPLNGFVYERTDDENVLVSTPDGRSGLFSPAADWIEGDLKDVSPHMCDWVGGKQLEEGLATMGGNTESSDTRHPMVVMAEMQRQALKSVIGDKANDIADIEFSSVFFTLFPNFHPWGSFNRVNYRFRPNGNNPEECIMECIYLAPIPDDGNFEPCRAIHWLDADDDWTEAPELGFLAKVFNQDFRNLPYVQQGLHASGRDYVMLADYNETKPRHFHQLLEEWISRE